MYINLGIIGTPLEHSLSPRLHNYFFYCSNLNGGYTCFDVKKESSIIDILEIFKRYNFIGFNVTVPYKELLFDNVDVVDSVANGTKSINTVCIKEGKLSGYNTDVYGFESMLQHNNICPDAKDILLIGAGGSAKSVLHCLSKYHFRSLTIVNKTLSRAKLLLMSLQLDIFNNILIKDMAFLNMKNSFDIVINATSLGLGGENFIDLKNISCTYAAIDLQYKRDLTPFLQQFRGRCYILLNGIEMLVYQGLTAFNIWTGQDLEIDVKIISDKLMENYA